MDRNTGLHTMMVVVAFAIVALLITGLLDRARDPAAVAEVTQHTVDR